MAIVPYKPYPGLDEISGKFLAGNLVRGSHGHSIDGELLFEGGRRNATPPDVRASPRDPLSLTWPLLRHMRGFRPPLSRSSLALALPGRAHGLGNDGSAKRLVNGASALYTIRSDMYMQRF